MIFLYFLEIIRKQRQDCPLDGGQHGGVSPLTAASIARTTAFAAMPSYSWMAAGDRRTAVTSAHRLSSMPQQCV
jgi:hypothetical protein